MRIVINSSPLITLSCINELKLLEKLFDEIFIPEAVYTETVINGSDKKLEKEIRELKKIKVIAVKNYHLVEFIADVLDEGEAEVIALAKEMQIKTVVIDELKGRKYARKHDLQTIGSLGILVLGKHRKYIKDVTSNLKKMEDYGIRIGERLKIEILTKADEI
ncbi:MAG: DUF3368 domain-containing protein [Candidatus Cloacimonetes bacterium]|nr:DUF3368 domain-containing protein [Candidatus Cloacimonadota bacterium]